MSGPDLHTTGRQVDAGDVEMARAFLSRMGLRPDDLVQACVSQPAAPTFAEYIPRVRDAVSPGTRQCYDTYWNRVLTVWADRPIAEPTASEIAQLTERIKANALVRRNARGGRSAAEHLITALRCLYRFAVKDGLIAEADNPAARVDKPRRLPSTRRGLPDGALAEINRTAAATGNDPALDAMLVRFHVETAARLGGALALRPRDLDTEQCLVLLREKGETVRWQPVSPTLMEHLLAHTEQRSGGDPEGRLLRYANGAPLTKRRYDYLWQRLGRHLPWVSRQQISTHWLRHTTLTWVERNYGYAVAAAYAGHTDRHDAGSTTTYIRASIHEVATALTGLTGEEHPLVSCA
jgi:integrase/recombinase XerC